MIILLELQITPPIVYELAFEVTIVVLHINLLNYSIVTLTFGIILAYG